MKIKRLELIGFKSFKDRTVINFDKGITGIVGPNGCGKSNIVDALLWVMGEQSAKHLRGSSMEDVIFNGSENFSPLGMAEVSLTLENDGGPFPAKWMKHTEVMITRRLHRSGESEYFINKEIARLKDIIDIFMDTGAGSKGFSIIEQGQIGKIITAKPEDRRTLIEEAAGITKFKVRKRESQRKLENTEQNLVRLNDIVGELRRQLDSLQRQAKRAERYKELKTEAQELDLWLNSRKFVEMRTTINDLTQRLTERRDSEEGRTALIATLTADVQTLKLELLETERRVNAAQTTYFELQSTAQKKESALQMLSMEMETTRRNEEMSSTLRSEVTARRDILHRDLDHVVKQLELLEVELVEMERTSLEKSEKSAQAQLDARAQDERLTQNRRELMSVSQGLTTVEVTTKNLEARVEDLGKKKSELEAVAAEIEAQKNKFEENRTKSFTILESTRQMQLNIMKDVENFESNLETLKAEFTERKTAAENFKEEHSRVKTRLEGLEALSQSFEGYREGVKYVMQQYRQRLAPDAQGGFQLVADVVEVPAQYEMAMEAALGDKLQSILSMNSGMSMAAVTDLKAGRAGRSTFISSDFVQGERDLTEVAVATKRAAAFEEIKKDSGFKTRLIDAVTVPDAHRPALSMVLDDVVIVDSLQTALTMRAKYSGFSFVTVDGDMLSHDGVLSGGSNEDADAGLLAQRREIKELSIRKDEMAGKLALATAALAKTEAQVESVTKDLEAAQKQNFEQEILIMERKKDLERSEGELRNADEALKRESREIEIVRSGLAKIEEQLVEAKTSYEDLSAKKEILDQTCSELEASLTELRSGLERLSAEATEAQVRAATKRESVLGMNAQQERLTQNLAEAEAQLSRMQEDSSRNSETITQTAVALEEGRSEFHKIVDEAKASEKTLQTAKEAFEQLNAKVRAMDEELLTKQREANQVAAEINEAQMKLSQNEMESRYILDQMMERYMVNMNDVAESYSTREGDVTLAHEQLEELRDKIKKIGEVNLTAIQEYEELSKRYEFLTKQQQDLLQAMDQLRKVIDRINRICNRRFRDTFEAVNERFKKVFPVLFGGGEAELILAEQEDAMEPGVEIIARPPGKKLQNVTLLSGGEKALTAVSLIFAIFLFKPSPFCLLDEVDAPLDDANVYRFNDLVREMARRSQVILVTHNKHTMEINNILYGVTMEEPGVSKMVSVRLE